MIRIGAVHGDAFLLSRNRLEQVQELFQQVFPKEAPYEDRIPRLLREPVCFGYRSTLLVAENSAARVEGFALLMHFASAKCVFLDFLGVRPGLRGGGIGGALYEAAREYAVRVQATALYLEVVPDLPELTPDARELEQSRRRLRFYENYGARVVEGTAYSTPVGDPPTTALLLHDGLGSGKPPSRKEAKQAVEMILTRRFVHVVGPEYVRLVVGSFRDDPVRLRPLQRAENGGRSSAVQSERLGRPFSMVFSPKHEIHHVQERGYFERPIRIGAIRQALCGSSLFTEVKPRNHGEKAILSVHDAALVRYLQTVCSKMQSGRPVYPDTFPVRRPEGRPREVPCQAGYYCIDAGTPLHRNAYIAARSAVDTALTAADELLAGKPLAYAVCRPPGHHAGRRFYGGFCYFNNAAIAAHYLSSQARTAILDLDFHHGNGTQDIFYGRGDVLTVSIHGHPDFSYPYFSGYENETGSGDGLGLNRNFPLKPGTEEQPYLRTLRRAIDVIDRFRPEVVLVSLGYDILRGDPTGTFLLPTQALDDVGRQLMAMKLPVLVIQEGGYNVRNIKRGSVRFFAGCASGTATSANAGPTSLRRPQRPKTGRAEH